MKIDFPIIALGASAGGLEPLEIFFDNTKSTSKYAYVIIQHLAPNHKSLMDELLARHTDLPIKIIENEMPIEKGTIYLNPPKYFVELKEGCFVLIEKEDRKLSFPISDFFISLAENIKDKSCAIIFSGTGSDGSKGLKSIKEKGGLVLVQDPQQAKFNGMPNNAIYTGVVDKVCGVEMMHVEIDRFFENSKALKLEYGNSPHANYHISQILESIDDQIKVDFTGYKYTTVSRRISRRMSILDFKKIEEYSFHLKNNVHEAQLLSKELLIGVTRFFRDEEAFHTLKTVVIPRLIEENKETKSLRVWVPACSTGEEAYSIAILIKDHLRTHKLPYEVNIFATDLDKEAIKIAANRVFPSSIGAEIPTEYLNTYFVPQKYGYAIAKEIREMIVFSAHNIIQDPPFNKIDLVSCRNLLIYLTENIQQQIFTLFQYALRTNGVLFLGPSENLGKAKDEFVDLHKSHNFFLNKENKKFIQRLYTIRRKNDPALDAVQAIPTKNAGINLNSRSLLTEIQHSLIQEYVPDSLIIDKDFNLLYSSGSAHRLLTMPSGGISANILKMLPDTISIPLEVVTNKVFHSGKTLVLTDIEIPDDFSAFFKTEKYLNIQVRKKELEDGLHYLFVTFESSGVKKSKEIVSENVNVNTVSQEKIRILERELVINKENLQTTIEELESSNEELQATNEELQSSNEELESVNEELYTVNSEYEQKNRELSQSNDDLNNLIHSTELAILFLDENLNIRKFTPAITNILDLVPHDIGRNISHFRSKIQLDDFLEHIDAVFESSVSYEFTIEDNKGKEYFLKIAPFKTSKNKVSGITLVFIDLSHPNELKKAIEISEKALVALETKHENQDEIFKLISNNLRDMVCIISKNGKIEYSSPSGQKITGFSIDELYSINLFDRILDAHHKELFQKSFLTLEKKLDPGFVEFEFSKKSNKKRWLEASIKPFKQNTSQEQKFLLTIRDIQIQKLTELEFIKNTLIAEQTKSAIIIADTKGKITYVNEAFEKMSGYLEEEVLGKKPGDFLQGEESDPAMIQTMSDCLKELKTFDVKIINYNKLGEKYLTHIKGQPLFNKQKKFIGFFSIQNDITEQEESFDQVNKLNNIIKDQYEKLEDVNKSLEEFAYIASHDLKTPIRNIKGLLEIIRKKGDTLPTEKKDEYFNLIISASKDMDGMISHLLEYSRTGLNNEKKSLVKFPDIFEEVLLTYDLDIRKTNTTVTYNDILVEEFELYPILFKRLVSNLISNAIKYKSDKDLVITISNYATENDVVFLFSDNGIGIAESEFENIFNIFKSLKSNKDSNGIGLSVCKKIAEIHHGKIELSSEVGKGTTFKVTLPKSHELLTS